MKKVINFCRIDEDELHRFYTATKGDIPCLLSSLKRTIRWRETYYLLSQEELESWSTLVFWHGFDRMFRPCLVIRLGHACSSLPPHDRPRFSQAVGMNSFSILLYWICLLLHWRETSQDGSSLCKMRFNCGKAYLAWMKILAEIYWCRWFSASYVKKHPNSWPYVKLSERRNKKHSILVRFLSFCCIHMNSNAKTMSVTMNNNFNCILMLFYVFFPIFYT